MNNNVEILEGNIFKGLIKLAIPIMATSFLQMAYNLIDLIWIGKLGSLEVAAVGTAGFLMWLGMSLVIFSKVGAEVFVSQSVGRNNQHEAKNSARSAIQLVIIFGVFYTFILIVFNKYLIAFFNIQDEYVVSMARNYLKIIGIGVVFAFMNPVFTSIYNAYGDSRTPFRINAVGLIINIILDPILIFYFNMGVSGAAIATIIGQITVALIFIGKIKYGNDIFKEFNVFKEFDFNKMKKIMKLGMPISLKSGFFTIIAMVIARIIASWGPVPIAVQKIGSQIEALSWMTSEGFATATSTYIGQNYGAKNYHRIKMVYYKSIIIMTIIGIIVTLLFLIFPKEIFSIFLREEEALKEGIVYLRILGISQLFMCVEITTSGAFNGLSKTVYHSVLSIVFNFLRIPMALMLSMTVLGLSGIWWSITISSIIKGVFAVIGFMYLIKKYKY
ncbi:MATE family efflux transporter [Clostridiaceae bacterium HSG29]|nr:MATE family efflux transporter [Clostridiaceae bacterium HSG29]